MEYDDARSGSFEPLRDVPQDKIVVLGLITTKKPELESHRLLARRIAQASRHFPKEQLGLSPQCGFASSIVGNRITPLAQRRKLELVVRAAGRVWR
ncbi:MAG TPA: vitamin-B12 independent methionine synthase [Candidatus Binatia bacterium]|nr:vitamin-B12 independent methionine synthase [Candidatus Binatia bacterium]